MSETFAVLNGRLFDGTGAEPIEDGAVLLRDGEILNAGHRERIEVSSETRIIDADGGTIMPGLIDAHVHLTLPERVPFWHEWAELTVPELSFKAADAAQRTLEAGFTTVRDAGACNYIDVAFRNAVGRGHVAGPRVLASGRGVSQTSGHGTYAPPWISLPTGSITEYVDGPNELRKAVRERVDRDVDWIKVFGSGGVIGQSEGRIGMEEYTREEIGAVIDEAHRSGHPVVLHGMTPSTVSVAIEGGLHGRYNDTFEHGIFLCWDDSSLKTLAANDVPLVPTFTAYEIMADGGEGIPDHIAEGTRESREDHTKSFELAREHGIDIVCGTDMGSVGALHGDNALELEYLVDNGMSSKEALLSATQNAAEALGIDNDVGTLEPGKCADLLVVDGDPLDDVSVILDGVKIVVKEGEVEVDRR